MALLGKLLSIVGALGIAGGVGAGVVGWDLWATGADSDGSVYFLVAAVAAVAWGGMKWAERPSGTSAGFAYRQFLQQTFAVTALYLGFVGFTADYISEPEKTWSSWMLADLRNLVAAQDSFLADSGRYNARLPTGFTARSESVAATTLTLTADGWTASIVRSDSSRWCAVFVGSAPLAPAVSQREPACTRPPFDTSAVAASMVLLGAGFGLGLLGVRIHQANTADSESGGPA